MYILIDYLYSMFCIVLLLVTITIILTSSNKSFSLIRAEFVREEKVVFKYATVYKLRKTREFIYKPSV